MICGCGHGRRSVGDGGDASPPLFRVGGQHRNCPPHFSVQKNCEAYNLSQHSSLLKAYIARQETRDMKFSSYLSQINTRQTSFEASFEALCAIIRGSYLKKRNILMY